MHLKRRFKKFSRAYLLYAETHRFCEACGAQALFPHHIRSRGRHGVIDEAWNLIALCWAHTYGAGGVHGINGGNRALARKYPEAGKKILAALERRIRVKKRMEVEDG